MKKTVQLFLFLLLSLVVLSCGQKKDKAMKKNKPQDTEQQMPLMADVEGVYQGQVPCADCEGTILTMQLNMDNTTLVTMADIGKDKTAVSKYGTWNLDQKKVTVTIGNETTVYQLTDLGNLSIKIDGKDYVLKRETE